MEQELATTNFTLKSYYDVGPGQPCYSDDEINSSRICPKIGTRRDNKI